MTVERTTDRFTAADVARFCGVDLKTIHNWANKGKLPHARTEGRHLRFRRLEIIDFLRAYSYPIPDALRRARPRVVLADADAASMKRPLARRFDLVACTSAIDALVAIGAYDPEALVIDAALPSIDVLAAVAELRASVDTRHLRIVVTAESDSSREAALAAGAATFLRRSQIAKLREALEAATGLTG